jgi:peptidoglycan/LPS O-acetylase OafA/YrhL
MSRIFRILPPLLFALALVVFLEIILDAAGMSAAPAGLQFSREVFDLQAKEPLVCVFTLCGGGSLIGGVNAPLWTLKGEIQLYVIVGLSMMTLHATPRRRMLLRLVLLAYLMGALWPMRDGHLSFQPVSYISFASGWIAQRFEHNLPTRNAIYFAILSLIAAAGIFSMHGLEQTLTGLSSDGTLLLAQIFYAIASAFVIRLLAKMRGPVWISRSGRFSYTLYIIHYPVLLSFSFVFYTLITVPVDGPLWSTAVVAGALTILLAWMMSKWVERPAAQRRAFIGWLRGTRNRFKPP